MASRLPAVEELAAPPAFDPEVWDRWPYGAKIRTLYDFQDSLWLPVAQHAMLRRLPYWAVWGPEHGVPQEWFNADVMLLPKYRPGGQRCEEFADLRRQLRRKQWRRRRLRAKWRTKIAAVEPLRGMLPYGFAFLAHVFLRWPWWAIPVVWVASILVIELIFSILPWQD